VDSKVMAIGCASLIHLKISPTSWCLKCSLINISIQHQLNILLPVPIRVKGRRRSFKKKKFERRIQIYRTAFRTIILAFAIISCKTLLWPVVGPFRMPSENCIDKLTSSVGSNYKFPAGKCAISLPIHPVYPSRPTPPPFLMLIA
jgi:hypothetical protein